MRTITGKNNKTPFYLVTRTHFSPESHVEEFTPRSRNSLFLLPLPLGIPSIVIVEPFTLHLHYLYEHNTKQLTISNYNYQFAIKSHKRLQDITIGDEILIRVHPKRFPLGTLKKLNTWRRGPYKVLKRFCSSAYKLDIFHDLGINLVFRVEDLTHYHTSTRP